MSNRRLSSPYFRYLKARLWNLARPGFWGTAIFLSVVGLTIREFWMRPDMFTSRQSKPAARTSDANSTLSPEDRAIVADIDNLPVLEHDSKQVQPVPDNAEPISQPKKGNLNPLQQAIKNQNTSNNTKPNSNSAPASSVKYENPFLTQAENLLQFGNPLRNGNNGFLGLNTANSSNQSNQPGQLALGLNQSSRSGNSTQRPVAANSLEAALNSSSLNPSPSQTPFGQLVNRNQPIVQPSNFLPSNNNTNTLPQDTNNSALPTQFAQPTITTQPQTVYGNLNGTNSTQSSLYYSNLNGANSTQPSIYYGNLNGANSTQASNSANLNGANLTQISNSANLNGANLTQISNSANLNGANLTQPINYYGNLNGANSTQPSNYYGNLNGANPTQLRTNNNFNSNNFNNTQQLLNRTLIPQTSVVTPSTSNTVSYPSATTSTPSNTAANGALITPTQPNQLQQYPYPTQVPSQYPNSGLPVRY